MVEHGYWVECFPISQNDNMGQDSYKVSIDVLPQVTSTGKSIDHAIEALRDKLKTIQRAHQMDGDTLPKSHSLITPTSQHRNKQRDWMSVYIKLDGTSN